MDLNYLRRLVKIFDDSTASNLEIHEEGTKIKMTKAGYNSGNMQQIQTPYFQVQPGMTAPVSEQAVTSAVAIRAAETPAEETSGNFHEIKSPIVGSFYRSPSPDSDPFVEVGSKVKVGQTLCIVEAMKLMNEIESDVAGTIEKIMIENGKPVEYNQLMFLIKPE